MSDIVERLRDDQPGERQAKREARMELGGLLMEAADEIERLRAENAKLAASNHAYLSDYQEARGEIENLREALRHYADDNYNGYNGNGAHARAALGEKE